MIKFSGDLKTMSINRKEIKFLSTDSDKKRENLENKVSILEKQLVEVSSIAHEMKNSKFYRMGFSETKLIS